MLARVRASLRQRLASESERQVVEAGSVSIDLLARTIRRGSKDVHVTPKEWDLLAELAKHPGRVLTHEMLLRSIWGPAHVGQTEYLRVAIRSLRQKLEEDAFAAEADRQRARRWLSTHGWLTIGGASISVPGTAVGLEEEPKCCVEMIAGPVIGEGRPAGEEQRMMVGQFHG